MKRGLSRRHFLGGAGAMIGLPLLTSLVPRRARGAHTPRKQRFLSLYVPCGMVMNNWTPAETGAAWTPSPILAPLDTYRNQTLVLSGIANLPGRSDGGGDHAAGTGSFLTCTHVKKTIGTDILADVSLDQLLAPVLSEGLPFPSLELGADSGTLVGDCDTGYSCAYATTIAWKNSTTPLPKQTKPRGVFDRMFAGYDPDASLAELERRKAYRKSVLDYGLDDATSLRTKLGRSDQAKLDEYMTGIREVEMRLDRPVAVCRPGERPDASYTFAETCRLMMDLIAIACECDQTRVITMMLGNAGSYTTHPQVGVGETHHELSHHMGSVDSNAKLTLINTWEVGELAYLMGRLAAIDDGDGQTALDNSVVFFGGEISDGDRHNHDDLPIIVAGGGSGHLISGQHIQYSNETQGNLFVTLLNAFGLPNTTFGDDGTRPIPGLLV
jgi:Protein of unknown function (DUF1552)